MRGILLYHVLCMCFFGGKSPSFWIHVFLLRDPKLAQGLIALPLSVREVLLGGRGDLLHDELHRKRSNREALKERRPNRLGCGYCDDEGSKSIQVRENAPP